MAKEKNSREFLNKGWSWGKLEDKIHFITPEGKILQINSRDTKPSYEPPLNKEEQRIPLHHERREQAYLLYKILHENGYLF